MKFNIYNRDCFYAELERALQGKNGIGRYILMIVIIIMAAQIASIPLLLVLLPVILSNGGSISDFSAALFPLNYPSEYGAYNETNYYL